MKTNKIYEITFLQNPEDQEIYYAKTKLDMLHLVFDYCINELEQYHEHDEVGNAEWFEHYSQSWFDETAYLLEEAHTHQDDSEMLLIILDRLWGLMYKGSIWADWFFDLIEESSEVTLYYDRSQSKISDKRKIKSIIGSELSFFDEMVKLAEVAA